MSTENIIKNVFNMSSLFLPEIALLRRSDPEKAENNLFFDIDPHNKNLMHEKTVVGMLFDSKTMYSASIDQYVVFDDLKANQYKSNDQIINGFITCVRAHVKAHGTIDNLLLNGHGVKLYLGDLGLQKAIDLEETIKALNKLSEEEFDGKPIFNNIILNGCNTLGGLTPDDVKDVRDIAVKNNINIVGLATTLYYLTGKSQFSKSAEMGYVGRYIEFSSNGDIKLDEYNKTTCRGSEYGGLETERWEQFYVNEESFEDGYNAHVASLKP